MNKPDQSNKPNKSTLFKVYNRSRGKMRKWLATHALGEEDTQAQWDRFNRAFGIVQTGSRKYAKKYSSTRKTCQCWDARCHENLYCKHMLAERMYTLIDEAEAQKIKVSVTRRGPINQLVNEARVNYLNRVFWVRVTYGKKDNFSAVVREDIGIGECGVEAKLRDTLTHAVMQFNRIQN